MRMRFQLDFIAAALLLSACAAGAQQGPVMPPAPAEAAQQKAANNGMPQGVGQPLDRVVAIVNGDLILDSDVNEEQRFEAFQPYRESAVFTREQTIERLINRTLILQQAALQNEDAISDEDVQKELDGLRKNIPACKRYNCATKAGWDRFLGDHGFTEAMLMDRWRKRMEVLHYIEERFRAGIAIKDDEVKSYYEQTMLPEYAKQGVTPPSLDSLDQRIREVLLEQRVSSLLSDWLKSLRAQGSVVVVHPGEEVP